MIYLDYNATTPIIPEALEAMMPYLTTEWGNPSSSYRFGSKLRTDLERFRARLAAFLGARAREILFTSGGTEANNTAIHAALITQPDRRHIVTSKTEHSSVLSYFQYLESCYGYEITYLNVDEGGLISLTDLERAITDRTALVSLMWANNETGVLYPVPEISGVCKQKGVLFHCDAVQAMGKVEVNCETLAIDYLSISGHKFGAPKGIGALYVRRKTPFFPFLHGGHQEYERRAGTESLALIAGMVTAAQYSIENLATYSKTTKNLRDVLEDQVLRDNPNSRLNGARWCRISNTTSITFKGVNAEALLILLDQNGICASSGSACLATSDSPSHVLEAMHVGPDEARQSIRFSLGASNTMEDIKVAAGMISALNKTLLAT